MIRGRGFRLFDGDIRAAASALFAEARAFGGLVQLNCSSEAEQKETLSTVELAAIAYLREVGAIVQVTHQKVTPVGALVTYTGPPWAMFVLNLARVVVPGVLTQECSHMLLNTPQTPEGWHDLVAVQHWIERVKNGFRDLANRLVDPNHNELRRACEAVYLMEFDTAYSVQETLPIYTRISAWQWAGQVTPAKGEGCREYLVSVVCEEIGLAPGFFTIEGTLQAARFLGLDAPVYMQRGRL